MSGFLIDNQAKAAIVLWSSGQFDTAEIAGLLHVREDAVYRTLHMAKGLAGQAATPPGPAGMSEAA